MVERFMCRSTVLYHGKCIRKIPGSTAVAHPSSLWAVLLHTWLRVSSLLFIFLTRETREHLISSCCGRDTLGCLELVTLALLSFAASWEILSSMSYHEEGPSI